MDNSYLYGILGEMEIQRTIIFTSFSSLDKDQSMRLIRKIEGLGLAHWSMYDETGKERNISGERYTDVISKMLKRTCVFLLLISKNSLSSPEVKREIAEIVKTSYSEKYTSVKIIPILIGDAKESDIPADVKELSGIDSEVIVRRLCEKTSEDELSSICEEIRIQYMASIFENVQRKLQCEVNSNVFLNIMDKCVKHKCSVSSISTTVKESREVYTDSLQEVHVLTNEMLDFDCNAFCCTVIASNILGNEISSNRVKKYNPSKYGVKYYYYYPEELEDEMQNTFAKIRSFVNKDEKSRREVTNLVRREFCYRNNMKSFFEEINNMTQAKIAEHYHIVDENDIEAFKTLFAREESQFYFEYSDGDDVFQVPDEFYSWLSGDADHFSYGSLLDISYNFISLIGHFVKILEKANDINITLAERLKRVYRDLLKLKEFDDWQAGKKQLTYSQSRRLVNYLLDYTSGSSQKRIRKFPKIAKWLDIEYDENGNSIVLDEKIVDAACNNLIAIPIKKSEVIKLSYSFELFIEETNISSAWYSVEQYDGEKYDNMVFSYEINHKSDMFDELLGAFRYLLEVVPDASKALLTNGSRLIGIVRAK